MIAPVVLAVSLAGSPVLAEDIETSTVGRALAAPTATVAFALDGEVLEAASHPVCDRLCVFKSQDEITRDPAPPGLHEIFGTTEEPPIFDIPMFDDPSIDYWVHYFQATGRDRFLLWLSRSTRFAPIYYRTLERYGLPKDLIFLAMIESGFSLRAYSWAHAAGPWQFIPSTARQYGLNVDVWVDERRDFELSAAAAARYLRVLHAEFGDWWLAWAAYNAGEPRIHRAIDRAGTRDFFKIARTRHLPRETRRYVPKLIAAARVAKDPELYGLLPDEFEPLITWDVVTVTIATDLQTIARACGDDVELSDLVELNQALYRGVTPPGRSYPLRVPPGKGEACSDGLQALPPSSRVTYRYHAVRSGDDASRLATKYSTSAKAILDYNKIAASQIASFDGLLIPIPAAKDRTVPILEPVSDWRYTPPHTPGAGPARVHRVRHGESLWSIARRYRIGLRQLITWNPWARRHPLQPGERLLIRGK